VCGLLILQKDMQESLNNFEIRHLVNRNIRNYPNPFEVAAPPPPPPPPDELGGKVRVLKNIFVFSRILSSTTQARMKNDSKQCSAA
jgi:hypothetical protein